MPDTMFKCTKCDREFDNKTGLRMHNIRKHSNNHWSNKGKKRKPKVKLVKNGFSSTISALELISMLRLKRDTMSEIITEMESIMEKENTHVK